MRIRGKMFCDHDHKSQPCLFIGGQYTFLMDALPYLQGTRPANPGLLTRFLPALEEGTVSAWLTPRIPAGSWLLRPVRILAPAGARSRARGLSRAGDGQQSHHALPGGDDRLRAGRGLISRPRSPTWPPPAKRMSALRLICNPCISQPAKSVEKKFRRSSSCGAKARTRRTRASTNVRIAKIRANASPPPPMWSAPTTSQRPPACIVRACWNASRPSATPTASMPKRPCKFICRAPSTRSLRSSTASTDFRRTRPPPLDHGAGAGGLRRGQLPMG